MLIPRSEVAQASKGVEILIGQEMEDDGSFTFVLAPSPGINNHTFLITANGDLTGGTVQLGVTNNPEEADPEDYAPLGGGPIDVPAGGSMVISFSNIVLPFVSAHIVTPVVGGTVTVSYIGN